MFGCLGALGGFATAHGLFSGACYLNHSSAEEAWRGWSTFAMTAAYATAGVIAALDSARK